MAKLSLQILSRTENLQLVREFIAERARGSGFDDATVQDIVLAVDEACTNIIRHGYEGKPDETIEVVVHTLENAFEVCIFDRGKTFDPATVKPPDIQKNADRKTRGGFGLYLMKKLMDDVEFRFLPGAPNELRMRKYLVPRS